MDSAFEAFNTRRVWLADLMVCAAAGVILAMVGPFGSFFNDRLIVRIFCWTAVLLMSGLVFGLALRWTWPRARRGASVGVWAPVFVLTVSLVPALISRVIPAPFHACPSHPEAGVEARPLPRRLDRSLVCLRMEDHYVRIHTETGSELVLMSLSQAIAALGDLEGLQTHRSWWVSRSAVTGLVEDGRKLRLTLTNGLEAPVSRARVAQLRAAGWL